MSRVLHSFQITSQDKVLDYRLGEKLDLQDIARFFQRKYEVKKIWNGSRHVLGILEKEGISYFLKLSTSEGIGVVTKNEYNWNNYFYQYFPDHVFYSVPKNHDSGIYCEKYFYLITDYLDGELLCDIGDNYRKLVALESYLPRIVKLSELIQEMPVNGFYLGENREGDFEKKFIEKTENWFNDIPTDVSKKFKIGELLGVAKEGVEKLSANPRHGDFTPWHMIKIKNGICLIDGEHAMVDGVENYDICYFIQRVFSVLKNPPLARKIYSQLLDGSYQPEKLKIVLAARAIGGFLDESLASKPDYSYSSDLKDWIISI